MYKYIYLYIYWEMCMYTALCEWALLDELTRLRFTQRLWQVACCCCCSCTLQRRPRSSQAARPWAHCVTDRVWSVVIGCDRMIDMWTKSTKHQRRYRYRLQRWRRIQHARAGADTRAHAYTQTYTHTHKERGVVLLLVFWWLVVVLVVDKCIENIYSYCG